jgi:hypothetical protein
MNITYRGQTYTVNSEAAIYALLAFLKLSEAA